MNAAVATRDWLEDPVTVLANAAVPLYALATAGLWLLARPYGNPRWKLASASALIAAALALAANQAIAHLWMRPRPFSEHPSLTHVLAARTTDPSFPSDHAATLIGLSRIALGMHYPSDVLAGALVGFAAAALVTTVGRPWLVRLVALVSRVTDPLLRPVWAWCRRLLPIPRL